MDPKTSWKEVTQWLSMPREFSLARGMPFKARYNPKGTIEVIPVQTGIARTISCNEWMAFIEKGNEVEETGYDRMRPGHYSQVSFNSSYLVAILKALQDQKPS